MLFLVGSRNRSKIQSIEEYDPHLEESCDYYFFEDHLLTAFAHVEVDNQMGLSPFLSLIKASLERRQKVFLIKDISQLRSSLLEQCQPHHYRDEAGYFYIAPSIRSKIKPEGINQALSFQSVRDQLLQLFS